MMSSEMYGSRAFQGFGQRGFTGIRMFRYIVSVRQVRKGVECSSSTRCGGPECADSIGSCDGEHDGSRTPSYSGPTGCCRAKLLL
jgi:hypothetical protein